MAKLIDSSYLKVIADNDHKVWAIDGDKTPKELGVYVDEFVNEIKATGRHKLIRVIASEGNHPLITKLYRCKMDGDLDSVQLATPSLLQKNKPASSLLRMRMCALPASLGGWHEMTSDDFVMYTMARLVYFYYNLEIKTKKDGSPTLKSKKQMDDIFSHITNLLNNHPVWPYLSFIDGINPVAAADVLTSICDPRWFVDPDRPDRLSKLYSWLGLSGHEGSSQKLRRAASAKACWISDYVEFKRDSGLLGKKLKDPSCFILKHANKKWGSDDAKWPDSCVSKYLVKFIKLSWMDCIYPFPNPWMEPLFNYSEFFKDPAATKAFRAFIVK